MIPLPYKLLALTLLLASIALSVLGYGHFQYSKGVRVTTQTYELAIEKQKREAETLLVTLTDKVRATEQLLQEFKNQQEVKDASNQKTVNDLTAKRTALGKLRDPYSTGCGTGSGVTKGKALGTSGPSAADYAQTTGVLSEQLSDLLWDKFGEADVINNAYISCRADLYNKVESLGK